MVGFKVTVRRSVARDLRRIPKKELARILERIASLAMEPRPPGAEKLSGQERYRLRQGVYRIVYEIKDKELLIVVIKVGHRRDVYKSIQ
uniref:mRNA interferase RelE/StbE n=1 Tax=Candidatus Kentrum sp. DK TaxID=2126562 RepID=A0A450T537_9GAMM|nr:MAG: mRNA interferase RelE/StbE [Candidatus Kentron sp. DK]